MLLIDSEDEDACSPLPLPKPLDSDEHDSQSESLDQGSEDGEEGEEEAEDEGEEEGEDEGEDDAEDEVVKNEPLSEYEKQRLLNIETNKQKLLALGLQNDTTTITVARSIPPSRPASVKPISSQLVDARLDRSSVRRRTTKCFVESGRTYAPPTKHSFVRMKRKIEDDDQHDPDFSEEEAEQEIASYVGFYKRCKGESIRRTASDSSMSRRTTSTSATSRRTDTPDLEDTKMLSPPLGCYCPQNLEFTSFFMFPSRIPPYDLTDSQDTSNAMRQMISLCTSQCNSTLFEVIARDDSMKIRTCRYICEGFVQCQASGICFAFDFESRTFAGQKAEEFAVHTGKVFLFCNSIVDMQFSDGYMLNLIQVYNRKLAPKKCINGAIPHCIVNNISGDTSLDIFLADALGVQISNAFKSKRILGNRILMNEIGLNTGNKEAGRVKEDGQIRFETSFNGKCTAFWCFPLKLNNSTHTIADQDMMDVRGWVRKRLVEQRVRDLGTQDDLELLTYQHNFP